MATPILTTRDVVERVVNVHAKGRTLDVGAGSAKYRSTIVSGAVSEYLTCDIKPGPGVDSVQDIQRMTFAEASFDTILAFQVFEHIKDPRAAAAEIFRCLKPEGVCIITAPFLVPQHADPDDYQRFTVSGMSELFSRSGFEIVATGSFGALFTVMAEFVKFMFINPYDAKKGGRFGRRIAQAFVDLFHSMDRHRLSKNMDVYANVYLVAKKPAGHRSHLT